MRVISGKARGTKLMTIEGSQTRPTTDRIKESLFNLIQFYVQDAHVLDLFSGSGALGIEAGSRGAASVTFVENNRKCHSVILENIKKCHLEETHLIKEGVHTALNKAIGPFDLVIMDPPYQKGFEIDILNQLQENNLLTDEAYVVVEHHRDTELPEVVGSLTRSKFKTYGITGISIYTRAN